MKFFNKHKFVSNWFSLKKWKPFQFQEEAAEACLNGESGLLNAPTGSGKTYALFLPALIEFKENGEPKGLQLLWITPLRTLAEDIRQAMQRAADEMNIDFRIETRTGDTSSGKKEKQKKSLPHCLITTPESLHILLCQKDYQIFFESAKTLVMDEWHDILGTKRGVQIELALSRIKKINPAVKIWGISATIGNLDQAKEVLLGNKNHEARVIKSNIEKKLKVITVIPEEIERFPWAGHLGIKLLPDIINIIEKSTTTLVFTNTRSQTEIWYQNILLFAPELAGQIAMHHGSISQQIRNWVESSLHAGKLKAVVCTSTLDLGVDFRPVETVIQIGGPKGVSRFAQRAGRSGHRPGASSVIYFIPTHSLELVEAAALKEALELKKYESRKPMELCFDVLIQYLVTLAVSNGFSAKEIYEEVKSTYCFRNMTKAQWKWCLEFITTGGASLDAYSEFKKVEHEKDFYIVNDRKIKLRHKLSVGTIVNDPMLKVQYISGSTLGSVEESFITNLKPGDIFWFAGKHLELVMVRNMTVMVRRATKGKGIIPKWMGGRMPLSSQLSQLLREKIEQGKKYSDDPEMKKLQPLFDIQKKWSLIPAANELLIEQVTTKEGSHLFFFPFEGRYVHLVLASVAAHRIGKLLPSTFSVGMNDYGFELLTEKEIPFETIIKADIFSEKNFFQDLRKSIDDGELAKRRFREIATIAGLVFTGFPGRPVPNRHLQASSGLFFDVFLKYDPDNLLLEQAFYEVMNIQLEQSRLMEALGRIKKQKLLFIKTEKPTPFAFPILAERFRETMSNEKIEDRIRRYQVQLEKEAGL